MGDRSCSGVKGVRKGVLGVEWKCEVFGWVRGVLGDEVGIG